MLGDPAQTASTIGSTWDRDRVPDERIERSRMSFGDHLEELRRRVLLSLLGLGIGAAICLYFGKELVGVLCRPLLTVQHAVGLHPQMQVLSPTGLFSAYLRVGILAGLVLSVPWILWQAWQFVAVGLYGHERKFLKLLIPVSMLLFAAGVAFLYYVALPIALWFFVTFNASFPVGDLTPSAFQRLLLPPLAVAATGPEDLAPLRVPTLSQDPPQPVPGDLWVNSTTRRLVYMGPTGAWSLPFDRGSGPVAMQSQFAIDEYLAFVLWFALAFGVAYELPVVVFFLAWTGIVSTATMSQLRRYVVFGIVVVAAVLTPPDVLSQTLLAVPMYVLFELGVLVARVAERRRA